MDIIIKECDKSKIIDLICLSSESEYPIVCPSNFSALYIQGLAEEMNIPIPHPIYSKDLIKMNNKPEHIYLYDVEKVIRSVFGSKLAGFGVNPNGDSNAIP